MWELGKARRKRKGTQLISHAVTYYRFRPSTGLLPSNTDRVARANTPAYYSTNRTLIVSDNVTLATDGAGVTTQTAFDADGNVTQSVVNGYTTTSRFDGDDNLTASIDGDGDTTTNGYDPADQLTRVTDPDSNVTSYTLDGDGNTTLVTSPQGYQEKGSA